MRAIRSINEDIRALALVKGPERYVFLWTARQLPQVLQTIGRFAADPELSFTWFDAARLNKRIREQE